MRKIGDSSALRAILLAWALSLTCLPTNLMAAPSDSVQTVDQAGPSDEPFGLSTETVTRGTALEKWLNVQHQIDNERLVLKTCDENRASCRSPAALQFLAIVDIGRNLEGRARLGEINRAINLKLKPKSDLALYREEDHAVVAARLDGNWLMLDNRHMVLVEDQLVRRYRPVFLADRDGVKLYSDTPSLAGGSRGYERAIGQIRR